MMATTVYLLCFITSAACAFLLLRGYRRTRVRLLFWSGICFVGLALNNLLLVVDVTAAGDLSGWRTLPALIGALALVFGLIWETR